jgi:hypothetical protein
MHMTSTQASRSFAGYAIAQAASRWLPTAAAWFDPTSGNVRSVVDTVALGQLFCEYCGFSCQFSFHKLHNIY